VAGGQRTCGTEDGEQDEDGEECAGTAAAARGQLGRRPALTLCDGLTFVEPGESLTGPSGCIGRAIHPPDDSKVRASTFWRGFLRICPQRSAIL